MYIVVFEMSIVFLVFSLFSFEFAFHVYNNWERKSEGAILHREEKQV